MTDQRSSESSARPASRGLLWVILLLQVVILGWLAKNHFDGASPRGSSNRSAGIEMDSLPPSLEESADASSNSLNGEGTEAKADAATNADATNADATERDEAWPEEVRVADPYALFRRTAGGGTSARTSSRNRMLSRGPAELHRRMMQAQAEMMQDFASFFAPGPEWAALPTSPSVDMRELEDAYELTMVQPGLTPESLDVRLNGRLLSLHSGQDVQSANRHSHQRFTTQLLLPGPVDPDCAPEIQTENNRIRIRVAKPGGDALAAAAPEVAPADPTAAERK